MDPVEYDLWDPTWDGLDHLYEIERKLILVGSTGATSIKYKHVISFSSVLL